MRGIISKIRRNLSEQGPWRTLKQAVRYLLKPVYEQETYMLYNLDLSTYTVPPVRSDKFSFRFIDEHDTGLIRQVEDLEEWLRDKVSGKLRKGGRCVVALDGETVAGFLLGNLNEMILPPGNTSRRLRPGGCFGEQITVSRHYQRQGLSPLLRNAFLREMKNLGMKTHYLTVKNLNTVSISAIEKFGYHYLAHKSYRRIVNCAAIQIRRVRGAR